MTDLHAIGLLLMLILTALVSIFLLLFVQYQRNEWRHIDDKEREARETGRERMPRS